MARHSGRKFRMYPTVEQMKRLDERLGCYRLIYNLALETKMYAYKAHEASLSKEDLIKRLPELKKEFDFLKDVNVHTLQAAIRNMGNAYDKFFKHGGGFPKFKRRGRNDSFRCPYGVLR